MAAKLTLAFAGERVAVTREHASALADFLWQGLVPGSATGAARLTAALDGSATALEFEPYETDAVRAGLASLGLVR